MSISAAKSKNSDDINSRIQQFVERVRQEGFSSVLKATCQDVTVFRQAGKERMLLKCLDAIAAADEQLHSRELKVRDRFRSAVSS